MRPRVAQTRRMPSPAAVGTHMPGRCVRRKVQLQALNAATVGRVGGSRRSLRGGIRKTNGQRHAARCYTPLSLERILLGATVTPREEAGYREVGGVGAGFLPSPHAPPPPAPS